MLAIPMFIRGSDEASLFVRMENLRYRIETKSKKIVKFAVRNDADVKPGQRMAVKYADGKSVAKAVINRLYRRTN